MTSIKDLLFVHDYCLEPLGKLDTDGSWSRRERRVFDEQPADTTN